MARGPILFGAAHEDLAAGDDRQRLAIGRERVSEIWRPAEMRWKSRAAKSPLAVRDTGRGLAFASFRSRV
jgi:hypothetical protein